MFFVCVGGSVCGCVDVRMCGCECLRRLCA